MIVHKKVTLPQVELGVDPVTLSDETMKLRKDKILYKMKEVGFDALIIYADLEHGGNFEYLCGFIPRFEEALLVLHQNGDAYMVLGNENLNKASKARLSVTPIHMPYFSLPNQPMQTNKTYTEILKETNLNDAHNIGLVGWKNFTSQQEDVSLWSDIPNFIVQGFHTICPNASFLNAAYLFIGEHGVRTTNNANEFAHYEFGATLAGNCMLEAMEAIDEGVSEIEIAQTLDAGGQPHSVVTIMASGARFEKANMYPSAKRIRKGDPISITTGYKGGLQSRGGYAVTCRDELPEQQKDYLERVAKPYYKAVKTWLETIHIDMVGDELYQIIENVLPKKDYGWSLNPGHLCADEEWLSSPIYTHSKERLLSGMLFQIDIIPSVSGYAGISCESGILLADESLRNSIKKEYPMVWNRIEKRRNYIKNELGIQISDEILPTSMATAFCRPYLLDKQSALTVE